MRPSKTLRKSWIDMSTAAVLKTILKCKSFILSTHVNPDPDALCSELALAKYLQSIGKRVRILNEEEVPERFKFLPGSSMLEKLPKTKDLSYDAAIIVDCGDLERIGKVQNVLNKLKPIINIDHHVTNDLFGSLNLVKPKASSAAEVLYDLFVQAKAKLTKDIAVLLYLGIMTDTGSFRYDNTTARVHEIVSRLLGDFQFSTSDLYKRLYEAIPVNDVALFTKAINKFDLLYGGKVVCVSLRKSLLKKFSAEVDLRDKIFSYLRMIKDVKAIVILTEFKNDLTRANFRSQSEIDVAKIAAYFKGGGHKKASGCVVEGDLRVAKIKILKQLEKVL